MLAWLILVAAWLVVLIAISSQLKNQFGEWLFALSCLLLGIDIFFAAIFASWLFLVWMGAWPTVPQ